MKFGFLSCCTTVDKPPKQKKHNNEDKIQKNQPTQHSFKPKP